MGSLPIQSPPRVWKRLNCVGHSVISPADCKRRRHDQRGEGCVLVQFRTGMGWFSGAAQAHVSRFAPVELADCSVCMRSRTSLSDCCSQVCCGHAHMSSCVPNDNNNNIRSHFGSSHFLFNSTFCLSLVVREMVWLLAIPGLMSLGLLP